jgi:hypothetical protein
MNVEAAVRKWRANERADGKAVWADLHIGGTPS